MARFFFRIIPANQYFADKFQSYGANLFCIKIKADETK